MSRLDELLNHDDLKGLQKHFKSSKLIQIASQAQSLNVPSLSTDNFELDAGLGGGLRTGRIHTFYGPVSSGKSFSAMKTIAVLQRSCSRCCALNEFCLCEEGPREATCLVILSEDWDRKWCEAIGVDVDRLVICGATFGEEGLDTAEVLMRTGKLDLVVIDSLAFLSPQKEVTESVAANHVGVTARMLGQFIRKFMSGLQQMQREGYRPTMLLINQIRMDLAVMFGSPEVKPGGRAPEFASTTETRFSRCKPHMVTEIQRPDYADGKFKISKNKQFEPHHAGEFKIVFMPSKHKNRGDIEDEHRMLSHAKRLDLMTQEKKKWLILGREFKKQEDVLEAWQADPEFKRESRAALIELMTAV